MLFAEINTICRDQYYFQGLRLCSMDKLHAAQLSIILQRQMPWAEQLATEGGCQTQQLAAESCGQAQAWLSG
jgi:hypothetical protein